MTTPTVDIQDLGVTAMAGAIASGEITPVDAVQASLARISEVDHLVKAWSYIDREGSLILAEELTAEAKAGKLRGPLHGVPIGIKEQFALAGVPTMGDWKADEHPVPEQDATVVARLRDAGAIVMGKLYMVGPSGTPPTRNPWNLEHTPGGSSSGSGAAVGARMIPASLSEQTGGSGIRPAAYCGVSGLKPTYGRVSRAGMFQMAWSHDHACIIGLGLSDVASVFYAIAGYDPRDPSSRPEPVGEPAPELTAPPRIGVVQNFFPELTQPVMQAAIESSAARLAEAGATVEPVYLPEEFGLVWPSWMLVGGAEGSTINAEANAERMAQGNGPRVNFPGMEPPASRYSLLPQQLGELVPATYYLQAQRFRRVLIEKLEPLFLQYDALLMATAPGPAPAGIHSSGDWTLLLPWSHLGNPAVSIPGGLSPEGMPLGLQLVGPHLGEPALLRAGQWCEERLGRLPAPVIG